MSKNKLSIDCLIRLGFRAPTAFLWTCGLHFPLIKLPQVVLGRGRNQNVIGIWGWGLAKIMGVRIHKVNDRQGEMGDMIVANHMGFLDIPVLLTFYPAVFVIKAEMQKVFFFGRALEDEGHVFVNREDRKSGKAAQKGVEQVLRDGDRIIIFPEGGASPGAERKPFKPGSFAIAQKLGKKVEVCVLDYLPNRKLLEWDVNRPMFSQLVDLFGRRKIDVSVEFFPAEYVEGDPKEYAEKWHDIVQARLEQYDHERLARKVG